MQAGNLLEMSIQAVHAAFVPDRHGGNDQI